MSTRATPNDELRELFRETILEHYRHPRNRTTAITDPDIVAHGAHTSCGDSVHLRLRLDDAGSIAAIEWDGQGCAISQASTSMMTRRMTGKTLAEAEEIVAEFRALLRGEAIPGGAEWGELHALEGVRQFPVRMRCALLGWEALANGITRYHITRQVEAVSGAAKTL